MQDETGWNGDFFNYLSVNFWPFCGKELATNSVLVSLSFYKSFLDMGKELEGKDCQTQTRYRKRCHGINRIAQTRVLLFPENSAHSPIGGA